MAVEFKLAELFADMELRKSDFMQGISSVQGALKATESILMNVARLARNALLVGAGVVAVTSAAYAKAERSQVKLEAVVKATGQAAGYTADELARMATGLQQITVFDDDAIKNAEALLATFRNIQGIEFREATRLILDISSVLGQDLKGSAIQVGKALNDPIRGMTALRRVGVSFSKQQTEQIKGFMAVNDLASAQRIIINELAAEFGGAATAHAQSFGGSVLQLKNSLLDLAETIGSVFAPSLERSNRFLQTIIESATSWVEANKEAAQSIIDLVDAKIQQGLSWLVRAYARLEDMVLNWRDSLGVLKAGSELAFRVMRRHVEHWADAGMSLAKHFGEQVLSVFNQINSQGKEIWEKIKNNIGHLWDQIIALVTGKKTNFKKVWQLMTKDLELEVETWPGVVSKGADWMEDALRKKIDWLLAKQGVRAQGRARELLKLLGLDDSGQPDHVLQEIGGGQRLPVGKAPPAAPDKSQSALVGLAAFASKVQTSVKTDQAHAVRKAQLDQAKKQTKLQEKTANNTANMVTAIREWRPALTH